MTTVIEVTDRPVFLLGLDPSRQVSPDAIAGQVTFGTPSLSVSVQASGVSSSGVVGQPEVLNNVQFVSPSGVASTATVGDPQIDVAVSPDGVASGVTFGTATSLTAVYPDGIDADAEAFGTATATNIVRPSGTGSTLAFGTPELLNLILIDPQNTGSTLTFGTASVINRRKVFRTPRNTYQWRVPPFKEYEGISLLRENGVWSEVAHPDLERTLAAEVYLGGGRDHILSESLLAELQAAGYSSTEEIVP